MLYFWIVPFHKKAVSAAWFDNNGKDTTVQFFFEPAFDNKCYRPRATSASTFVEK